MPEYDDDEAYPVNRITAGSLGEPGRRVFILQVHVGHEPFSWVIEKGQAVALSRTIPLLLKEVSDDFPELEEPLVAAEPNLALSEPLAPLFRVGSLGVGYDRVHDLVVLTLVDAEVLDTEQEILEEGGHAELRVFTTRGQALLLSQQVERVVAAGRPICPGCGEPMDDFGHFCLPDEARNRRGADYLH